MAGVKRMRIDAIGLMVGQHADQDSVGDRVHSMKVRQLADAGPADQHRFDDGRLEVVPGDLADRRSLEAALQGCYGVFSVQPSSGQGAAYGVSDEDEVRYGKVIADLALASGDRHFVYSSANAAGPEKTGVGHFDTKSAIEEYVPHSGLTTHLGPWLRLLVSGRRHALLKATLNKPRQSAHLG